MDNASSLLGFFWVCGQWTFVLIHVKVDLVQEDGKVALSLVGTVIRSNVELHHSPNRIFLSVVLFSLPDSCPTQALLFLNSLTLDNNGLEENSLDSGQVNLRKI